MKKNRFCFGLNVLTVFALSSFSLNAARATLGESSDSITKDRGANSKLYPRHKVSKFSSDYTVHQIDSSSNSVREYVSSNDVVFAVCWNGIVHPELDTLLGTYNDEYRDQARRTARNPASRNSVVKGNHVTVAKWGHMGNLQGCAVDPSLVPAGVNANELK